MESLRQSSDKMLNDYVAVISTPREHELYDRILDARYLLEGAARSGAQPPGKAGGCSGSDVQRFGPPVPEVACRGRRPHRIQRSRRRGRGKRNTGNRRHGTHGAGMGPGRRGSGGDDSGISDLPGNQDRPDPDGLYAWRGERQVASAASQLSGSSQSLARAPPSRQHRSRRPPALKHGRDDPEELRNHTAGGQGGRRAKHSASRGNETMARMLSAIEAILASSANPERFSERSTRLRSDQPAGIERGGGGGPRGEAGRGFAVVAEEVRNLAMGSAGQPRRPPR